MDVGGRYHITQLYFNGHGDPRSVQSLDVPSVELVAVFLVEVDSVRVEVGFSFFPALSANVVVVVTCGCDEDAALLKSNAVPGVFVVLVADPNEEKAPEPNPKAAEAPPVGDDIPAVVRGEMLLKGLERPPWELPPPNRLFAKRREVCSEESESP